MQIVDFEAAQRRQPRRLRRDVDRPRAADDFPAIRARMEELRREREHAELAELLPSCDTKRWVAGRKAAVVIAVREGVISRGKACDCYQLSSEELANWEVAFKEFGTTGLRASYRFPEIRAAASASDESPEKVAAPGSASSLSQARGRLGVQRGLLLRVG